MYCHRTTRQASADSDTILRVLGDGHHSGLHAHGACAGHASLGPDQCVRRSLAGGVHQELQVGGPGTRTLRSFKTRCSKAHEAEKAAVEGQQIRGVEGVVYGMKVSRRRNHK